MKKKLVRILLGSGWFFFVLLLISGYVFNSYSGNVNHSKFKPIAWDGHLQVFDGAIQCSFVGEALLERKAALKERIFSKVVNKEVSDDGITYYFEDDSTLLSSIFEDVQIEKACCPFFKFDISILPFGKGVALKISGSEAALEMIESFETMEL